MLPYILAVLGFVGIVVLLAKAFGMFAELHLMEDDEQ